MNPNPRLCSASPFSFLEDLNPPQKEAATLLEKSVLVLAAAGTGKTRALTARIAYILSQRKALPSEILAVTFTNKAALEMRHRVSHLVGPSADEIWLGTFHSLCTRILRRHAALLGFEDSFTILDTDDQLRLLKQVSQEENLDEKNFPPRLLLQTISRWKDRGLLPHQAPKDRPLLLRVYHLYQERLKILNAVDFGDLLLHCVRLLTTYPDILHHYQNQFKYIMVDEYQDTNVIQYLWLRLLAQGPAFLCCVGDDDQSIYGWRGAEISNILRFEKDFSPAHVIRLEQNYRSTPHILGAASGLISHNEKRLGKTMWTDLDQGEKVKIVSLWDGEEEAQYIGSDIESLHRKGCLLSSMAVLVRAGFQTREFEDQFIRMALPYRVIGGPRFYERQEIRDALAYLRLVVHNHDGLAFERVLNTPRRGLGKSTLQTLHHLAQDQGISLLQSAFQIIETDDLKPQARRTLGVFLNQITEWRRLLSSHTPSQLARIILDESGYTTMLQEDTSPEAPGRLENLKELIGALDEFHSLPGFLEHVSLVMETGRKSGEEGVSIMTLHSAKGLEFDYVFLAGWEEGVFPNPRSLEELGQAALEEERRLAYVGLTRARIQAMITHVQRRRIYNSFQSCSPSRFIEEIPSTHKDMSQSSSFRTGYHSRSYSSWNEIENQDPGFQRPSSSPKNNVFLTGRRVFHEKFGYGYVTEQDGERLLIQFEKTGFKKILLSFVTLVK